MSSSLISNVINEDRKQNPIKSKKEKELNVINEYSDPDLSDNSEDFSVLEDEEEDQSNQNEIQNMLTELDLRNISDPSKCPKYAETIFQFAQLKYELIVNVSNFSKVQNELTLQSRNDIIDWMIENFYQKIYSTETLFLSVLYFDTCFSSFNIPKEKALLYAVSSILIAAKLDQKRLDSMKNILAICNNQYTREDIIQCEQLILRVLNFNINPPSSKFFLRRYLDAIVANIDLSNVSRFLCEITLYSFKINKYRPDYVAVSCIILGLWGLNLTVPYIELKRYSHFTSFHYVKKIIPIILPIACEILQSKSGPLYQRYISNEIVQKSLLKLNLGDFILNRLQEIE